MGKHIHPEHATRGYGRPGVRTTRGQTAPRVTRHVAGQLEERRWT